MSTKMDSNARYAALDNPGLEVAEQREESGTVPGVSPTLTSHSTFNHPGSLMPGRDGTKKEEHGNYYAHGAISAPAYTEEARPTYISSDAERQHAGAHPGGRTGKSRRICGMRRAVFWALIAALLIVIIGAVLGGVLGTLLKRHRSPIAKSSTNGSPSDSPTSPSSGLVRAMNNTGIATVLEGSGSGRLLIYYQDTTGSIMEDSYFDNHWSLDTSSELGPSIIYDSLHTVSALAAVSYASGGATYRQVFFINAEGQVMSMLSSSMESDGIANQWNGPSSVSTEPVSAGPNVGLTACNITDGAENAGLRVYYGSSSNAIQEVKLDQFSGWTDGARFSRGDPNSGVACATFDPISGNDNSINVYMRNNSGFIEQHHLNIDAINDPDGSPDVGTNWNVSATAWGNLTVLSGSNIAACNDNEAYEYVFFKSDDGMINRGRLDLTNPGNFASFDTVQNRTWNTKLSATYAEGNVTLLFQNSSSGGESLWTATVPNAESGNSTAIVT